MSQVFVAILLAVLPFFFASVVHFVADFCFQTDWQAQYKSSDWRALSQHVLVYALCFYPIWGFQFFLITFLTHLFIDYNTSRITKRLWAVGDTHMFFVVIGFDQLLHQFQLWVTLAYVMAQQMMAVMAASNVLSLTQLR